MTLKFLCACGQKLAVKEESAGKTIRCPRCKSVQMAPRLSPAGEPIDEDKEETRELPTLREPDLP